MTKTNPRFLIKTNPRKMTKTNPQKLKKGEIKKWKVYLQKKDRQGLRTNWTENQYKRTTIKSEEKIKSFSVLFSWIQRPKKKLKNRFIRPLRTPSMIYSRIFPQNYKNGLKMAK